MVRTHQTYGVINKKSLFEETMFFKFGEQANSQINFSIFQTTEHFMGWRANGAAVRMGRKEFQSTYQFWEKDQLLRFGQREGKGSFAGSRIEGLSCEQLLLQAR